MEIIEQHKDSLTKLCQNFQVEKMYLFGSALGVRFDDKSDLDFLVRFSLLNARNTLIITSDLKKI
jgi:predicted nucleotidyltransferase